MPDEKGMSGAPARLSARPYLMEIELQRDKIKRLDEYPFSLPAIRHLNTLSFHPDVTFIIGENGSGKSTLIEAIARNMGFNAEGGSVNFRFSTRDTHSSLNDHLKVVRSHKRPSDGFFLRAESFYNASSYVDDIGKGDPSFMREYGSRSLHEQSHGEAFLSLLLNRFRGHGLYILDEPEAALSPTRQLSALAAIHRLVKKSSQFIIATHSPILMAYPGATIYRLSETGIDVTAYTETEHYRIMRLFLERHESMLQTLFEEE